MSDYRYKIEQLKSDICQLQATEHNGLPVYYFLKLHSDRLDEFKTMIALENINLNQYGVILRSGYGVPSPEDKLFMQKEYNFTVKTLH